MAWQAVRAVCDSECRIAAINNTGVMKHTTGPRRGRPRGNGKRFPSGKNQNFESSGPEVKIRGTAQQVYEKYLSLARDSLSAGDRIAAEGYFQFADHYFRIVNAANGNGQARPERSGQIPPPPESAAGQVTNDEGSSGKSGVSVANADASGARDAAEQSASEERNSAPPKQHQGDGRGRRKARPATAQGGEDAPASDQRFVTEVQGAEPAAQAEELAQALSGSDAPASEEEAKADADAGDNTKRRRRSPLGIARKRSPGRPRKTEDAVAAAPPVEENADNSGVVKTVRRGTRKTASKPKDTATETVENV